MIPGISIVIPGILIGTLGISKISDFWNAIHMTLVQRAIRGGLRKTYLCNAPNHLEHACCGNYLLYLY